MTAARFQYRLATKAPSGTLYDWTVYSDDPKPDAWPAGATPGLLVDGLQLAEGYPEDSPIPCQPKPPTLTFQVAGPDAQALAAALVKGNPVAYRTGQLDPDQVVVGHPEIHGVWHAMDTFTGRISEVVLDVQDGYTVATVTAVGWFAALGEVIIGDVAMPAQSATDRITSFFTQLAAEDSGLPSTLLFNGGDEPGAGNETRVVAAKVGARSVMDLVLELFGSWPTGGRGDGTYEDPLDTGYTTYELTIDRALGMTWGWQDFPVQRDLLAPVPVFTDNLVPDRWVIRRRFVNPTSAPPATISGTTPLGTPWTVSWHPSGESQIPGDTVELSTRWSQRMGQVPNVAVLSAGYTGSPDPYVFKYRTGNGVVRPRVRTKRTVITDAAQADTATYHAGTTALFQLAFAMVPSDLAPPSTWGVESLTWRAAATDGYLDYQVRTSLGSVVAVVDIDPTKHPTGKDYIVGRVGNRVVKIVDGLPVVTLTLRPQLRDSRSGSGLTFGTIPASVPAGNTLKFNNLPPGLTIEDLRLLRSP